MPSSSFNLFMQNKNPKPRSSSSTSRAGTDDSDIIKAAAWAWYQHGSGSEAKIIREFDVFRPHRPPRPSRYKLEAMRTHHSISQSLTPSPIHTPNRNSLLDKFEIESISKRLDSLIESSKFDGGGAYVKKKEKKKKKKPIAKGFWPRHAVMCGAKEDMVNTAAYQRPVRFVPLATSKPRATHDRKS
ncbi:hypothetical protein HS088_TW05G00200 [Tripterygium wilfordii]|uniref:Uncharacterized protein n=1 Tax=Tripterygium wilfordii TaxID=458696 RepID=A0A7J7DMH0_TRIWF|nr:uncharacterized protein LOC119999116 [Tripterygium wilfordii]KAF5747479.1 hypothetical protein HS088_TW05G00200 [Tripterygium wilfordii]